MMEPPPASDDHAKAIDRLWANVAKQRRPSTTSIEHPPRKPRRKPPRKPPRKPSRTSPQRPSQKPSQRPSPRPARDDVGCDNVSIDSIDCALEGQVGDPLLPERKMMDETWDKAQWTWRAFVANANGWPAEFFDTRRILGDIPAIPREIPKNSKGQSILEGQPIWHVSDLNEKGKLTPGARKRFNLLCKEPVRASIAERQDSSFFGHVDGIITEPPPDGLTVLIFCWSYILCASLIERQGYRVTYTEHLVQPQLEATSSDLPAFRLPSDASDSLERWLCALLAPKMGWTTSQKCGLPPWALICSTAPRITRPPTSRPRPKLVEVQAPDSEEALLLLKELCSWYDLHRSDATMPALESSFIAALAIPYYRWAELDLQLPPLASIEPRPSANPSDDCGEIIDSYSKHLPYYMTLSLQPISFGSILWSVFWQPSVACNVASSWLNSTLDVLEPVIAKRDVGQLARIFAARRPLAAILWLGVFLLGDVKILDRIRHFLRSLTEGKTLPLGGPPDITVSAWTRSPQSFWDLPCESQLPDGTYDRAEILQRRLNFQLSDQYLILFAWKPFSPMDKTSIEIDLYDYLEHPFVRQYVCWQWGGVSGVERGFRQEQKGYVAPDDNFDFHFGKPNITPSKRSANLAPSKRATLQMLNFSMTTYLWERCLDYASIPGLDKNHAWLRGWRGLE
ncbi:uncharacterized protein B0I36DRAFT_323029 [Microdochium trichocladiopsis]|uniref:Uncharacterized protein n=1 Tax=Microdochium trichocladiopsis TaxID=1682393 RepID=A0A9P8Y6T2_9PEZI|nr:uncharacterized protein B0I36DRAFT_323029 [Microdochium trichocladiopsis]KAH7031017.1 hypothetical protein B0I36DRAFT_323029 [Microdochium trichocladiopsis]